MDEPLRGSQQRADGASTATRVREIFASAGFRRFVSARVVSQFGDGVFQLSAAAVLLFEDPSANPAVDLLAISAVTLIPFSAIGPFVGVFIDRWDRRKILTRVPILRALTAVLLPAAAVLGTRSVAFYAVVLVVLSANRFFLATMAAILPQLVPADDLIEANSAATTGGAVANVLGQASGSALAAVFGGERAAIVAAVAFALSAMVARLVPAASGPRHVPAPLREELRAVLVELGNGLRALRRSRRVVYGLTAITSVQAIVGAMLGALAFYFIAELGLSVGSATSLAAVLAIGIGAGVVLVPLAARRAAHETLILYSFGIAAAGAFAGAVSLSRVAVVAGAGVIGVSYAFVKIPVDTIVQEEMPDVVRGRAFAVYDMLFNVARVAGLATAALAYMAGAGTRALIVVIGAVYVAGTAALVWMERRYVMRIRRKRRGEAPPVLQAGEIVTVRAHAGSRADEEPRAIVVGGRELPIDEIDWRAVVEERGKRSRVFVVRCAGVRIRLAYREDDANWEIERIMPEPTDA